MAALNLCHEWIQERATEAKKNYSTRRPKSVSCKRLSKKQFGVRQKSALTDVKCDQSPLQILIQNKLYTYSVLLGCLPAREVSLSRYRQYRGPARVPVCKPAE